MTHLWENVILTKVYLPQMAPVCLTDTGNKRGEFGAPGDYEGPCLQIGRMCVSPVCVCAVGKGWPIVDWWWRVTRDGRLGSPVLLHPE